MPELAAALAVSESNSVSDARDGGDCGDNVDSGDKVGASVIEAAEAAVVTGAALMASWTVTSEGSG